jgi:hypothetical protein
MKKISVALFFLAAFHTVTFSQTVRKNNIEYSAVSLSKKDKIFLALKDTAQKHLRTFIDNLNKHGRDSKNYQFAVNRILFKMATMSICGQGYLNIGMVFLGEYL